MKNGMLCIGIPGSSLGDLSFGAHKDMLDFAARFGKPHIILPDDGVDDSVDALLLPGGMDINPNSYNEVPGFYTGNIDTYKQYFFEKNLPQYIEAGIPVFGICLGFQQLMVYLGAKVCQHLRYHPHSNPPEDAAHKISLMKNGLPYIGGKIPQVTDKEGNKKDAVIYVNSTHHQAVLKSALEGNGEVDILMTSTCEDFYGERIVEAFRHKTLPIAGCQYHPERYLFNDYGFAIELARETFKKAKVHATNTLLD